MGRRKQARCRGHGRRGGVGWGSFAEGYWSAALHYVFTALYRALCRGYCHITLPLQCSLAPVYNCPLPATFSSYPLLGTSVTGITDHIRFRAGLRVRRVEEARCCGPG